MLLSTWKTAVQKYIVIYSVCLCVCMQRGNQQTAHISFILQALTHYFARFGQDTNTPISRYEDTERDVVLSIRAITDFLQLDIPIRWDTLVCIYSYILFSFLSWKRNLFCRQKSVASCTAP